MDCTLFHVESINFHPIYSFNAALYVFRCSGSLAPIKEPNEFCPFSVLYEKPFALTNYRSHSTTGHVLLCNWIFPEGSLILC